MSQLSNASYFIKKRLDARTPSAFDHSFLRARGFDARGARTGGIATPGQVTVPEGAALIRTYGGEAKEIGQWWFTVSELKKVLAYVGHADLAEGRKQGKGILHGFLAVLSAEWGNTCEFFVVASLRQSLYAFYGEGDHATYGAAGGQKAALMFSEGRQRAMRQVFLPQMWEYPSALTLCVRGGNVDQALVAACRKLPDQPLPFESQR